MIAREPLDLGPILAREAAARPGPWTLHGTSTLYMNGHAGFFLREAGRPGQIITLSCWPADAEFLAHAREDVPALLAEVERLRAVADITEAATAYVEEPEFSDNVPLYWEQLRGAVEHYRAVEARLGGGPS